MNRLLGCLALTAVVAGCNCNVQVADDPDAGGGGAAGGGVSGTGGGSSGGTSGGSSAGGTAGGSAGGAITGGGTSGGTAGGDVIAGGAAGGVVVGGGAAGGDVLAGGSAGGVVVAGGAAGGIVVAGGAAGGIVVAGGTAGGVVVAGGTAGGMVTAGGSAGGAVAGGTAGGMIMQDTYVCGSCANAADTNPGTQTQPVRTITRGLQLATTLGRPTVFVGTAQGAAVTYAENLVIPAGVTVQGRWSVSGSFAWTRTAPRALVVNTQAGGLTFAAGSGRTTGLDGLIVRAATVPMGTLLSAAISIVDGSPLIFDTSVEASTSASTPGSAIGISVAGSGPTVRPPNPRIAGVNDATRATITAGAAVTNSIAIFTQNATVELEFLNVQSGNVGGLNSGSVAVQLNNSPRSLVRNLLAQPGLASQGGCAGITANGDTTGIVIDTVTARGCPLVNGTPALASLSVGFGSCAAIAPGGVAPRVANSTIQTGVASGPNSWGIGVLATNGCAPTIDGNAVTGSTSFIAVPQNAVGIGCTHEPTQGTPGANAACRITNNRVTSGRASNVAWGVSCLGNCATGDATCLGSCAEISTNTIVAADAPLVIHASVLQSSPRVARNQFGEGGAACSSSGPSGGGIFGLRLEGSGSRVENNVIIGGNCSAIVGLEQVNALRARVFAPGPDVHSNTIIPAPSLTGFGASLLVGVSIRSPQLGSTPVPPLGTYRNNIISVPNNATVRFAFREQDTASDPAVLENNDFWAPTIAGMPPLYLDEGTTTFNAPSQINMLNGVPGVSSGALSVEPGFALGSPFRLSGTSAMRGAGVTTSMPRDDFDGTTRPNGSTAPDIGADEVP